MEQRATATLMLAGQSTRERREGWESGGDGRGSDDTETEDKKVKMEET